ncbi:MAG TPA: EAL domain-containing protein [Xanthobacteraceae bacterium]|nr:EAL domain-containing protein [Xanthobacteraceae bacterium]
MRLGAIFVAVCMTVISASAGAVAYYAYGFSGADAAVVAIASLTALALYNAVSTRMNVRSVVGPQLAELSRSSGDLARQLAEVARRLAAVEARQERASTKEEAAIEPLAAEISELGTLLDQLAETVAIHETQLGELTRPKPPAAKLDYAKPDRTGIEPARLDAARPAAAPPESAKPDRAAPELVQPAPANTNSAIAEPAESADPEPSAEWLRSLLEGVATPTASVPPIHTATVQPSAMPAPLPPVAAPARPVAAVPEALSLAAAHIPAPAAGSTQEAERNAAREVLAATRSAVEGNRIDLHLQPIVTLPQRKVRFYEAMSRLRTESGEPMLAADFIAQAEAGGLMPKIDNLVVFRCVQVLRRLLLKNREVGVFCNLSMATLTDAVVFPQLLEFLDANRAIAPSLVLEFKQSGLRAMGPIETEGLTALRACGYSFSMDNVTDLRLAPRDLAGRGFRFIKLKANLILNRSGAAADIHPGDLPDLLSRFGIDLIAERIESEGTVVDLLDYDVKFGQGFLFSPPRPVRAEALQGIAERNDVVARDAAAALEPGAAKESGGTDSSRGLRSAGLARVVRRV